ncbi:hypothetical protein [Lactobacillus sp. 3B(2020)]|uniref:hypothetical protein n=1 Tax=Lactobacillus sp. 3B(2020) TaxID=2695882 RepID=UPI0015E01D67|nr:hypothetical protein [Lactobacillus sp. 3B(2020)]QLL71087.1 hypothetical protein GTO83_10805 [Lactobacillus sp. 3B(2020)]
MIKKYTAEILPLNAEKIGTAAHGTATFTIDDVQMKTHIDMFDTLANVQHWEHFHGFPDGKPAEIATVAQDANGDGFVDLPETESVSGTTMVPFNADPAKMHVPNDDYPVADADGHYNYEKLVDLKELQRAFKDAFGSDDLQLDKRVIYIHGVPDTLKLPTTVQGTVMNYDTHVTLPIAVGKIVKA